TSLATELLKTGGGQMRLSGVTKNQILDLMALRYGDVYRRMGFADFVSCMLRLETMTCESWSFITGCLQSQHVEVGVYFLLMF
uniref:Calpain-3/13-like C-terminal EF-hand domain-containing protein n=1 Tax=Pavo cristatus TaxID=9049 RepID=A0A8C9FQE6_PAVCR